MVIKLTSLAVSSVLLAHVDDAAIFPVFFHPYGIVKKHCAQIPSASALLASVEENKRHWTGEKKMIDFFEYDPVREKMSKKVAIVILLFPAIYKSISAIFIQKIMSVMMSLTCLCAWS